MLLPFMWFNFNSSRRYDIDGVLSVWIVTLALFLPMNILNLIFKIVCRDK